jgi:hypothetical protein
MMEVFGEDCLPELDRMMAEECLHELQDNVEDFPKVQLIIDQADSLYPIYHCMKFLPVPAHKVRWEGGMTQTDGILVTSDNY